MSGQTNPFRVNWSGRAFDYTQEEIDAVVTAMKTADPLTQGPYLAAFEKKFSEYLGVKHSFAVANCTNALDLIALQLKLGPNDEVIMPAHTFCASAIPFGRTGAKLVWADVDPKTWLISASSIEKKITPRTKAILVVHLYGLMADMDPISKLAKKHSCALIEDCAQSAGATYQGKKAGSFGDFAAFSFHGQKSITTLGEGGMLVVKSDETAKLIPGLRHNGVRGFQGDRPDYWIPAMSNVDTDMDGIWPYNFCLGEVQCALGAKILERLDSMNVERNERAQQFISAMSSFPELKFQDIPKGQTHSYHLLPARYDGSQYGKTRDDLIRLLSREFKVKAIIQYYPLYRYPLFQKMGFAAQDCVETESYFDKMVSFPFHHWMSDEDFAYLIDSTKQALQSLRK